MFHMTSHLCYDTPVLHCILCILCNEQTKPPSSLCMVDTVGLRILLFFAGHLSTFTHFAFGEVKY